MSEGISMREEPRTTTIQDLYAKFGGAIHRRSQGIGVGYTVDYRFGLHRAQLVLVSCR